MKALNVSSLCFSHGPDRKALDEVSFQLDQGETLAVIGPNGAGKTTLLLALCGLIDFSGRVDILGEPMSSKNGEALRRRMSLVFQNPDDQLFMPTVGEDVAYGLNKLGYSPEQITGRVTAALDQVDMAGSEGRSAHHLSYGEKRRVTLATALARDSEIMFFDEPTRELDPGGRREFKDLLHKISATKIISSHDLDFVAEVASVVMLLDQGGVIRFGDPVEILSDQDLMEGHRLEVPHFLKHHHPHI